jgi:hypothetical protein
MVDVFAQRVPTHPLDCEVMAKIPPTMLAAAIDRFGKAKELKIRDLPVPEVGPGDVLIAVHTAGVGSWDADMRGGWWPAGQAEIPVVLGTDGSGSSPPSVQGAPVQDWRSRVRLQLDEPQGRILRGVHRRRG